MPLGSVDNTGAYIQGWAFDADKPDEICLIDVLVNGELKQTFSVGNLLRPDVARSYQLVDANCGFTLDAETLDLPDGAQVELRFSVDGTPLYGKNPFTAIKTISKLEIFEGEDGYWFYSGDRNQVVKQMLGDVTPSDDEVETWANRICLTQRATESVQGKFIFVVMPDKIAINPRLLSRDAVLSEGRAVCKLIGLSKRLYGIDILYPLQDLRFANDEMPVLVRTDSHLSWRAQHEVSQIILEQLELPPEAPLSWSRHSIVHDLATFNGSNVAEDEDVPTFSSEPGFQTHELNSRGTNTVVYVNPRGRIPLAFVCGHSSCRMYASFLKETVRVIVLFYNDKIPAYLIPEFRPGLVIHYMTERNLHGISKDLFGSTSVIERNLIARGVELGAQLAG